MINAVRKKNARIKQHVLNPLSLVDLVVYHKEKKGLHRAAEVIANPALQLIPFDVRKSSVVFFLAEVLNKAVHEEESNPLLFDFIFNSVQMLDQASAAETTNFHLHFLIRLSKHLGFYPASPAEALRPPKFDEGGSANAGFFNLQEGIFQNDLPPHPFFLEEPFSGFLKIFLQSNHSFTPQLKMTLAEKRIFTEKLLEYYQLHLEGFRNIQSYKVLEATWS
jgi:DNA repair protein RecO (recombination protein O)